MLIDTNVVLALMWRQAYGHEAAHRWLQRANRFYTVPSTEWAAVRVSVWKGQGGLAEILPALASVLKHPKRLVASDAPLPDPDWRLWPHLLGHKLVSDFWLIATAEALDTELVTLDAKAWEVLPQALRQRVRVLQGR